MRIRATVLKNLNNGRFQGERARKKINIYVAIYANREIKFVLLVAHLKWMVCRVNQPESHRQTSQSIVNLCDSSSISKTVFSLFFHLSNGHMHSCHLNCNCFAVCCCSTAFFVLLTVHCWLYHFIAGSLAHFFHFDVLFFTTAHNFFPFVCSLSGVVERRIKKQYSAAIYANAWVLDVIIAIIINFRDLCVLFKAFFPSAAAAVHSIHLSDFSPRLRCTHRVNQRTMCVDSYVLGLDDSLSLSHSL